MSLPLAVALFVIAFETGFLLVVVARAASQIRTLKKQRADLMDGMKLAIEIAQMTLGVADIEKKMKPASKDEPVLSPIQVAHPAKGEEAEDEED
jgi:hypothetical protein